MITLFVVLLSIGLVPLGLGFATLKSGDERSTVKVTLASILLCALSFNLTFLWQELWLVIPKALTAGLHPVLYHNDHEWTGTAPVAELLQGCGAIATLVSGLSSCAALRFTSRSSPTRMHFLFWMSFEGLFQSFTQVAIGALVPGNDVGRALAYLRVGPSTRGAVLALAIGAMAAAGAWLGRAYSADFEPMPLSRKFAASLLLTALGAILFIVPFRIPRSPIEVIVIPLIVNVIGGGWVILGASLFGRAARRATVDRPRLAVPSLATIATLLLFQLVLRRGIAF